MYFDSVVIHTAAITGSPRRTDETKTNTKCQCYLMKRQQKNDDAAADDDDDDFYVCSK